MAAPKRPKNDYGVWAAGVTDYKVFKVYIDADTNLSLELIAHFEDKDTANKFCDTWRGSKEEPEL